MNIKIPLSHNVRNYSLLTKPGIIMGNLITMAGGFFLASRGTCHFALFAAAWIGLGLVIASACVFNNYIDRFADAKMVRTRTRPLVTGVISGKKALVFALFLGVLGTSILLVFTNGLTTAIALFGFFAYVILYSFSKYRSVYGTVIGSVAGAIPPVVGYCTCSHQLDLGAWIVFGIIALWQMPHFFAIAIYRLEDYIQAGIPLVPIQKGMYVTKVHMLLYVLAFIAASSLLTIFNYTGMGFFIVAMLLGIIWAMICLQGFTCVNDKVWARKMFIFSLIVVMGQSLMIPFSVK